MPQSGNFTTPPVKEYQCEHCGKAVIGGRYNNHCPHCLWSKHVDDEVPGDRASKCHGLMAPLGIEQRHGKWRITHECQSCGKRFVVDAAKDDDYEALLSLAARGPTRLP